MPTDPCRSNRPLPSLAKMASLQIEVPVVIEIGERRGVVSDLLLEKGVR